MSQDVTWGELRDTMRGVVAKGVAGCLDAEVVGRVVGMYFMACRCEGAQAVTGNIVSEMAQTSNGEGKAVLLNLFTAMWLSCWGKKWVPSNHEEADRAIRSNVLQALTVSIIHNGPNRNDDLVDSVVCSWNTHELIDDAYLAKLRACLFTY
eukprot:TRINITY_DN2421_c1_g1_i2.p1 TRINITY_DN2421_c1_g1~~TRINITY_DN2421_c1_g1_i2.p1  ORF type:complete len:167 (+),score=37.63 TRINITY_DN2421_c1_g1_i2:51-503(+)